MPKKKKVEEEESKVADDPDSEDEEVNDERTKKRTAKDRMKGGDQDREEDFVEAYTWIDGRKINVEYVTEKYTEDQDERRKRVRS